MAVAADPRLLADAQAVELAALRLEARRSGDWSGFAAAVQQLRSAGVPVRVIGAAVGLTANGVLTAVRRAGAAGVEVRPDGWATTGEAATRLGVARDRLARRGPAADTAGISRIVGWHRWWDLDELERWWNTNRDLTALDRRVERDAGSGDCSPRASRERRSPPRSGST